MEYSNKLFKQNVDFYNNLCDEESKFIYRALLAWRCMGLDEFYKCVKEYDKTKDYGWNELDEYKYFKNPDYKGIVLFGCGGNALEFYYQCNALGYKVIAFCDNNEKKIGGTFFDLPIISPNELVEKYADSFVIVTPTGFAEEIKKQLISMNFKESNICCPVTGFACIYNLCKRQYFDNEIISPSEDEIFIDAGAFDGQTVLDFKEWADNKYNKIYALEPSKDIADICREKTKELKNVEVVEAGAYSKDGELFFDNANNKSGAATISDSGSEKINVIKIDSLLKGEKATYIKMDIEGSELETLKGAANTIKKYKPRLAICVYHKPDDIFVIPQYIMSLRDDYNFYMRKYTPHHGEIVLYAV